MSHTILVNRSSGIVRLTLNRPEQMNSVTAAMHEELRAAMDLIEQEIDATRVVVVSGAGRAFCSGQDLRERAATLRTSTVDLGASLKELYAPLVLRIRRLPVPFIAAVHGVAAGAGCSLALACDVVIAASSASFVQSFASVGLIPDCGATWFVPRLVGRARALGLAMLADRISADHAERLGLIWRSVPDDQLSQVVDETAAQLMKMPRDALAKMKQAFDAAESNSLEQQLDLESQLQQSLGRSDEYKKRVLAFADKRSSQTTAS